MAKASQKRKSAKRLNPSKFSIVEATTADASRYVAGFSRLVYSYEVIKDKHNMPQVKQVEARNLVIQKASRELCPASEEEFLAIISKNVHVFFFVKESLDYGFAVVDFENPNSAYIANLCVFRHLLGMGTLFYEMLENHLKDCGFTKITLTPLFEGCKPFWKKMGFTPDPDRKTAYHKFL